MLNLKIPTPGTNLGLVSCLVAWQRQQAGIWLTGHYPPSTPFPLPLPHRLHPHAFSQAHRRQDIHSLPSKHACPLAPTFPRPTPLPSLPTHTTTLPLFCLLSTVHCVWWWRNPDREGEAAGRQGGQGGPQAGGPGGTPHTQKKTHIHLYITSNMSKTTTTNALSIHVTCISPK